MDGRRLLITTLLLLLGACGGGSNAPLISGEQAATLGTGIDARILQYLEDNDIPGATVAVTKNGRLVLWKGYGWADRENQVAMQPWHRIRIGSTGKLITAIGVLQLVDAGDVTLDQPLYSSRIGVLWNGDQPGFIYAPDGALSDVDMYFEALAEAPARLAASSEPLDVFMKPAYLQQQSEQDNVERLLEWASEIEVWHALSHRAGYLRSGSTSAARSYWNLDNSKPLSYPQLHAAMLAGTRVYTSGGVTYRSVPLRFQAGTDWSYSNHGFGLLGQLVSEKSGQSYPDYIQQKVFAPLGLTDIVPSYTPMTALDARGYLHDKNGVAVPKTTPPAPNPLGIAAGGWAANAYDVARILCGLDSRNDPMRPLVQSRRLLETDTLATMNRPDAYIMGETSRKVLGWDAVREGDQYVYLTKNGAIDSFPGSSRASKYFFPDMDAVETEINVAVLINSYGAGAPPEDLLNEIAEIVGEAAVPTNYDLFDEDFRCVSPGPTFGDRV